MKVLLTKTHVLPKHWNVSLDFLEQCDDLFDAIGLLIYMHDRNAKAIREAEEQQEELI